MVALAGCSDEDPEFEEGDVPEDDDEEPEKEETEADEESETQDDDDGSEEGEAVFEIVDTDEGTTFLSSEEQELGGIVENTGDATGEKEIGLYDDAENLIDGAEVELEPGETFYASVTFNPGAFEPGEYVAILSTEDDTENFSFTVEDDGPSEEDIEIVEHEMVIDEGDYMDDIYVEGIVSNNADTMASYVQVTVRIYDGDGNQLDSYIDNTSDLAADTTWAFEVMILEDAEDIDDYDIAVEDIRF